MTSKLFSWRTFWAAVVWFLNIVAVLVYILTYNLIERWQSKLIFAYSCFLTLWYGAYQMLKGFENNRQKCFIILSFSSLSVYFLFIILYYQFGVAENNYKAYIGTFLITELITIGCVAISGLKRGLFKNDKTTML